MTDWIADAESGSSVRAKLNSIPNDGSIAGFPVPALVISGAFTLSSPWRFAYPSAFLAASGGLMTTAGYWWLSGLVIDTDPSSITALELVNIGGFTGNSFADFTGFSVLEELHSATFGTTTGIRFPAGSTLTTIDFPALTYVFGDIVCSNNTALDTVNLAALKMVSNAGALAFTGNTALVTLDLQALETVDGAANINGNTLLTSLNLSSLVSTGGTLNFGDNSALASVDLSSLQSVGGNLEPGLNPITVLDLLLLQSIAGWLDFDTCTDLTTVTLPSIVSFGVNGGQSISSGTPGPLSSFTIGPTLKSASGDVSLPGFALDQASVDNILTRFAALDGTGGTTTYDNHNVDLSGGTNAIPSVTGLAAKVVLESRGCAVSVNS